MTGLNNTVLQAFQEFQTMYVPDFSWSFSHNIMHYVRYVNLSSRQRAKYAVVAIEDINSWNRYQIMGHLALTFGVEIPVEEMRANKFLKDDMMSNSNKLIEDATNRATMWSELINTDVTFQALYSLGELMARMDGYNDLSLGGTYIKTFVSVLTQKKRKNPLLASPQAEIES